MHRRLKKTLYQERNNMPSDRDIIHPDGPPPPLLEPTNYQQNSDNIPIVRNFPNFPSFLLPRENPQFEGEVTHSDMSTYSVPTPSREGSIVYHGETLSTSPIHT